MCSGHGDAKCRLISSTAGMECGQRTASPLRAAAAVGLSGPTLCSTTLRPRARSSAFLIPALIAPRTKVASFACIHVNSAKERRSQPATSSTTRHHTNSLSPCATLRPPCQLQRTSSAVCFAPLFVSFSIMCKWYCTSEGPSTNLQCLHCRAHYCGACLHGDGGKMESLVKCASCGKKPRVQPKETRATWKGESTSGSTAAGAAYTPSSALKQASTAAMRVASSGSSSQTSSAKASPKKSPSTGKPSIFDKLTDTSLYTGTHQHRFDASGQGRGLDGRESVAKGVGGVPLKRAIDGAQVDLSTILRPDPYYSPATSDSAIAAKVAPKPKSTTASPKKGPSIFDKLTDSSQYTGAHKSRFDMNGNGRGMAGRDGASGVEYGGGRVSSLAQITRTNLR